MPTYNIPAYSVSLNAYQTAIDFGALGARVALGDTVAVALRDDDAVLSFAAPTQSSLWVEEEDQGPITAIEYRSFTLDQGGTMASYDFALLFRNAVADVILVPVDRAGQSIDQTAVPVSNTYAAGGTFTTALLDIGSVASSVLRGDEANDFLYGDGLQVGLTGGVSNQIYRLYQATLGRAPDENGHAAWTARVFEGEFTLVQAAGAFVASQEFQNVYGALNNTQFVEQLYQNVLGREADSGGLQVWLNALAGPQSRADVVVGFSESAEFVANSQPDSRAFDAENTVSIWTDDVFRLYQATLGRAPDLRGLENWSGRLGDGMEFLDVVSGFVASAEFQTTFGMLDNAEFVELLYQNVLDRSADAGGLAAWVGRLEEGQSREQIVRGFSQSVEFIAKTNSAVETWMRDQGVDDIVQAGGGTNTVMGGQLSDTFVFTANEAGSTRVMDLERWDNLDFRSFGYQTDDDVRAHMAQVGSDVVFEDQSVRVVFANTGLGFISDDMIL